MSNIIPASSNNVAESAIVNANDEENGTTNGEEQQQQKCGQIAAEETPETTDEKICLPMELCHEMRLFLPWEDSFRLLLQNRKLSQVCIGKARQQFTRFEELCSSHLEAQLNKFHAEVPTRIRRLRENGQNMHFRGSYAWLGRMNDQEIVHQLSAEIAEIQEWSPPRAVQDAMAKETREKRMCHLLWCIVNLYHELKRNKYRHQQASEYHDSSFSYNTNEAVTLCTERQISSILGLSQRGRERIKRDYCDQLDKWKAEIAQIEGERLERLQKYKTAWFDELTELDDRIREHIQTLNKTWKSLALKDEVLKEPQWLKEVCTEETKK